MKALNILLKNVMHAAKVAELEVTSSQIHTKAAATGNTTNSENDRKTIRTDLPQLMTMRRPH